MRITVKQLRTDSKVYGRVQYAGDRLIVTRYGKNAFALVPLEDLKLLRALDEEVDRETYEMLTERAGI